MAERLPGDLRAAEYVLRDVLGRLEDSGDAHDARTALEVLLAPLRAAQDHQACHEVAGWEEPLLSDEVYHPCCQSKTAQARRVQQTLLDLVMIAARHQCLPRVGEPLDPKPLRNEVLAEQMRAYDETYRDLYGERHSH